MARTCGKSQKLADLADATVQKDPQAHLLSFLDWLAQDLLLWRNDQDVAAFERLVAPLWYAQQKLMANHKTWHAFADDTQVLLAPFFDDSPSWPTSLLA